DEKYERVLSQLNSLDKLIKINKDLTYNRAFEFGRENKREKTIYTIASGAYYYDAYSFSSCLLMEMLWINSNAIHSGEYFHGPFEITDYDVPFLIIKGEGPSQSLDNRAINFAEKFSEKVEIVDISKLDYTGIDEDLKEYFGPAISGSVLRQYAEGLAEHTGHRLSVRRYMWKMDYEEREYINMLKFDEKDYMRGVEKTQETIKKVEQVTDRLIEEGINNIFFISSGGSVAQMQPLHEILKKNSSYQSYIEVAG